MIRIGPIKLKSGWGFIDEKGEFVVEPAYEDLGEFSDDLASFKRKGKVGFLDVFGNEVVEPKFDSFRWRMPHFSEGKCAIPEGGRIGYIDRTGKWSISPQFGDGFDFLNGKAIASLDDFVIIDGGGNVLTTLPADDFQFNSYWPASWSFFVGQAWQGDHLFGIGLNDEGSVVFPPRFPVLTDFWQGVAGFAESDWNVGVLFGLVKANGDIFKPPQFFSLSGFSEGMARAGKSPTEFGYINTVGEWVIPPQFRQACPFREGLACVTIKGRQGFVNQLGEIVIEPKYRGEASFFGGYAQVEYDGKRAVIDKSGRVIWETEIESGG